MRTYSALLQCQLQIQVVQKRAMKGTCWMTRKSYGFFVWCSFCVSGGWVPFMQREFHVRPDNSVLLMHTRCKPMLPIYTCMLSCSGNLNPPFLIKEALLSSPNTICLDISSMKCNIALFENLSVYAKWEFTTEICMIDLPSIASLCIWNLLCCIRLAKKFNPWIQTWEIL